MRFVTPPGWPTPPPGWQFWQSEVADAPVAPSQVAAPRSAVSAPPSRGPGPTPPSPAPTSASPASMPPSHDQPGLSGKAVAGIVAGLVTAIALVGLVGSVVASPASQGTVVATPSSSPEEELLAQVGPDPTPEPEVSEDAELTAAAAVLPLREGSYSGELTVTEDTMRWSEDAESSDLVGTTFRRTVTLDAGCDVEYAECQISHETLALFAEPNPMTWGWPWEDDDPTEQSVTLEASVTDDCVLDDGTVVGTYDTTITQVITLRDAAPDADGVLRWTTADVRYLEKSASPDNAECAASTYRAEGTLTRD